MNERPPERETYNEKPEIISANSGEIAEFEPIKTRKYISLYEFTRVITDLALHLYELPDIERFVDDIEIANIIDPCTLAFKLLMSGKFNAIIDRGYEKVTFSRLKKNKNTIKLVENYLKQQENNRRADILEQLRVI